MDLIVQPLSFAFTPGPTQNGQYTRVAQTFVAFPIQSQCDHTKVSIGNKIGYLVGKTYIVIQSFSFSYNK